MILKDSSLLREQVYVGGQWIDADDGRTLAVRNPATGELLLNVAAVGTAESQRAVAHAVAAQKEWQLLSGKERSGLLRAWFNAILDNIDDLALIMTLEQGKPLAEARGEIAYAASFIEWFAEEAKRVDGEVLQPQRAGQRIVVLKQPIGVCAAITPWNFPAAMITRKASPPPFSALALAE
eukprot:gene39165-biopygen3378